MSLWYLKKLFIIVADYNEYDGLKCIIIMIEKLKMWSLQLASI